MIIIIIQISVVGTPNEAPIVGSSVKTVVAPLYSIFESEF
jgi:hypothetical protein